MVYFKKFQYILFSFILLCSSIILLWWVRNSVQQSGEELKGHMQTLANENAFDSKYRSLLRVVEETRDVRETLDKFILRDESDTIKLLSDLDSIAVTEGVDFSTQSLKLVEEKDNFNTLNIQFDISGNENNVTNMIRMFEILPFRGSITSLSLQRTPNGLTGGFDVEVRLELKLSIKKYDK